MKWNSNTRDNLAIGAVFVGLFGGGYFIRSFYPEVWEALGTLLFFVIILGFVAFVVWSLFFNTDSKKETTTQKKIIKLVLFITLVFLAMWWLSKPVEVIYDPSAPPF